MLMAGIACAQQRPSQQAALPVPVSKPTAVVHLFRSPDGHPNGLETTKEGLWIAEEAADRAYLVDWKGNVLHMVATKSHNVSSIAAGGGPQWMACNVMDEHGDPGP